MCLRPSVSSWQNGSSVDSWRGRRLVSNQRFFHDIYIVWMPAETVFARGILPKEANIKEFKMLNWIITFFLLAIVAAVLGFGGLAGTFAEIAKFLAVLFVVIFVATLVYSMITGRQPNPPSL